MFAKLIACITVAIIFYGIISTAGLPAILVVIPVGIVALKI